VPADSSGKNRKLELQRALVHEAKKALRQEKVESERDELHFAVISRKRDHPSLTDALGVVPLWCKVCCARTDAVRRSLTGEPACANGLQANPNKNARAGDLSALAPPPPSMARALL
jgi:hypothetical protein